jgi:hypothetical protein
MALPGDVATAESTLELSAFCTPHATSCAEISVQ